MIVFETGVMLDIELSLKKWFRL